MWKNKTGKSTMDSFMVVVAIVLVLAVVGVAWKLLVAPDDSDTGQAASTTTTTEITTTGSTITTSGVVSCPSDDTTDGQVLYEDILAATNTYKNPTVYFMPQTEGQS